MNFVLGMRDRLYRNPRFQQWAAAFPLTRGVAHKRAGQLFDLCAGFVYSQVLYACIELDILSTLADGPLSNESIAGHVELDEEPLNRLLSAAMDLQLLQARRGGKIGLGRHGSALLGNPGVIAMIRHHRILYQDLSDPVALLRDRTHAQLSEYWAYAKSTENRTLDVSDTVAYSQLMAASQTFVAREVLASLPLRRYHSIMDVGGGYGAFLEEVSKSSKAELTLFDLPAVVDGAEEVLEGAGLGDRIRLVGGDFFHDPLPCSADLISLVRILHDHDDEKVSALLASIRQSLSPKGHLLIAEPMAGTPGAEAMGNAYFGMYLWAMGSGRPRTFQQIKDMLLAAGFSRVQQIRTRNPLLVSIALAS